MNYYNTAHIIAMSFLFIFMPICGMEEKTPVITRGKFVTLYLKQKLETADDIKKHIENTKTIISFLPKDCTERSFSAGIKHIINGLKKFNTKDELLNTLAIPYKFEEALNDFHNLLKKPGEIDPHNINPIMVEIFQQKLKYNYQFDITPDTFSDTLEIIKILHTSTSPDNPAPTYKQYSIKENTLSLIKTYITRICTCSYYYNDYYFIDFLITADIKLQELSYLKNQTLNELLKNTIETKVLAEINLFKTHRIKNSCVDSNKIIGDLKKLIINTQTTNEKILQSLNDAINDVTLNKDTIDKNYNFLAASYRTTHKQYMEDRDATKDTNAVIENAQKRDEEKKRLQPIIDTYLNKNVEDFIFTTKDIITDCETLRKFINPYPFTHTNTTQVSHDEFTNKCKKTIDFLYKIQETQKNIKEQIYYINDDIKKSQKTLYTKIELKINTIINILNSWPITDKAKKSQLYKNIIETLLDTVKQTKIICMFEIDSDQRVFFNRLDQLKEDLQKCSQIDQCVFNTACDIIEEAKKNNYYTEIISLTEKYYQNKSLLSYTAEELSNDLTRLQMYQRLYFCNYPTHDTEFKNSINLQNTKHHINFCIENIKTQQVKIKEPCEKLANQVNNLITNYPDFLTIIDDIIKILQNNNSSHIISTDIISNFINNINIKMNNNIRSYINICLKIAQLQSALNAVNINGQYNTALDNLKNNLLFNAINNVITCSISPNQYMCLSHDQIIKTLTKESKKFKNDTIIMTMFNNLKQELFNNKNKIDIAYNYMASEEGNRQGESDKRERQQKEEDLKRQATLEPIINKYIKDEFSQYQYNGKPILFNDNVNTDLASLNDYKTDHNTNTHWKLNHQNAIKNLEKIIATIEKIKIDIKAKVKPFLNNTNANHFELTKIIDTIETFQKLLPKELCPSSQLKNEVTSNIKLLLNTIECCNYKTLNLETLKDFSKIFTDKTNKMYINDQKHNEECLKIIDGFISSYIKTLINTYFNEESFENINDFDLLQANTTQLWHAQQKLNSKNEFDNATLNTCFVNACKKLDIIGKNIQANGNKNTEIKNNNEESETETSDNTNESETETSDNTNESGTKTSDDTDVSGTETSDNTDVSGTETTDTTINQSWSYNPFPSLWSFITIIFNRLFSWRPW